MLSSSEASSSNPPAAFSLRKVEQVRGGTRTLRDVDLDIPAGEVVALVGPSGAGKTSLIRLLDRLDDPSSGEVTYNGAPIASIPVRELLGRALISMDSGRPTRAAAGIE